MKENSGALELVSDRPSSARTVKVRGSDGKRRTLSPKIKLLVDHMVYEGLRWDEAARAAEIGLRYARAALKRHHVITHLRTERAAFRASLAARNEIVVADIRDNGENQMARLHAAKYLDGDFTGEAAAGSGGRIVQPGVVVLITPPSAVSLVSNELIEVNPEHESGTL